MFNKPNAVTLCKDILLHATEICSGIKKSQNIDFYIDESLSWTTPVTDDYLLGNLEGIELLCENIQDVFIEFAQNNPENELIIKKFHDELIDAKSVLRERNPGRIIGHKQKKS